MKKEYFAPFVKVALYESVDVICTSGIDWGGEYGSDSEDNYGYDFWD